MEPSSKKTPTKDIKIVELEGAGAFKFASPDGIVTVYSERGKELTYERILWLLEKARHKVLHG